MNKDAQAEAVLASIQKSQQKLEQLMRRPGVSDSPIGRRMADIISEVDNTVREQKKKIKKKKR